MPAQAGIQNPCECQTLDSRFRGNDKQGSIEIESASLLAGSRRFANHLKSQQKIDTAGA